MRYLILNYGQFRIADRCFENNIRQLRSNMNESDIVDICILSQFESDNNRQINMEFLVKYILKKYNCNLIFLKYIEDFGNEIYNIENEIQDNYRNFILTSTIKSGADMNFFVCKMWYRRYFLNKIYKEYISSEYDYVILSRLFDMTYTILKPLEFLKEDKDILYYSHDTLFIGKAHIIDKLLEFGKDMYSNIYFHRDMLTDNNFLELFNKYDRCLSENKAIYSSEMQVCYYIYKNIENSINIRLDYTDHENRYLENAYIDAKITR